MPGSLCQKRPDGTPASAPEAGRADVGALLFVSEAHLLSSSVHFLVKRSFFHTLLVLLL